MPNWCSNYISFDIDINKDEKNFLKKLKEVFNKGDLNNYFIPRVDDFYENRDRWGTKWDIDPYDFIIHKDNIKRISLSFGTAWSPNIPVSKVLYQELLKVGKLKNYKHEYEEDGCGFYGVFDGNIDRSYDMNILYYILNDNINFLSLESNDNKILKFEDIDSLFLIKNKELINLNYYEDFYDIEEYNCFSEKYGDDIEIYKYNNDFYSFFEFD